MMNMRKGAGGILRHIFSDAQVRCWKLCVFSEFRRRIWSKLWIKLGSYWKNWILYVVLLGDKAHGWGLHSQIQVNPWSKRYSGCQMDGLFYRYSRRSPEKDWLGSSGAGLEGKSLSSCQSQVKLLRSCFQVRRDLPMTLNPKNDSPKDNKGLGGTDFYIDSALLLVKYHVDMCYPIRPSQ